MISIRPIVSLFLACTVLIASIGVTVNFHICSGQIQSAALFTKATPCKMDIPKTSHSEKHSTNRKGCCKEESLVLKGKETNAEVKTATQLTPSFNLIAVILPVLYSIIDFDSLLATQQFAHYKPPLKEQDRIVFFQVFLI
jgi:hypothetical protein